MIFLRTAPRVTVSRIAHSSLTRPSIAAPRARRSMSATALKEVVPVEAAEMMQSKGTRYLDVRTPEEFTAGRAPGSINVPLLFRGAAGMSPNPDFLAKVNEVFQDKAETFIVGCKSGARSSNAVQIITSQAGYQDPINMKGGFDSWAASGLPIEK